jgi:hypothetical protein
VWCTLPSPTFFSLGQSAASTEVRSPPSFLVSHHPARFCPLEVEKLNDNGLTAKPPARKCRELPAI